MKTLVTGGAGFIGSAVVRKLLARGREVRCMVEPGADRQNLAGLDVELVTGDVRDRTAAMRAMEGCDVLYHLAALYRIWMEDPSLLYEVNVEGTKTMLWAAYRAGARRVIHTSSIAALGLRADGQPSDETTQFNLWDDANAYIRSKWLSERDALRFAAEGLPLTVVCPAFPFGERDIGPTPTGRFVVQALAGRVPAYPDGGFNVVDVLDVAEAHLLAEERGRVGERYLASGHNVTYREFYGLVADVAGVRPPRRGIPGPALEGVAWCLETWADRVSHREPLLTRKAARFASRQMWFDNTKVRTELGLEVTPLRDTIERSVRWFREGGRRA